MAKTNKFTSINFNHIYEKNLSTNSKANANSKGPSPSSSSSSPSFSYSAISSPHNNTHGRMLVLTRPTPKPISIPPPLSPQPQPQPQPQQPHLQSPSQQTRQLPDQIRADPRSDAISLRPLGRTGSSPPILSPVPRHKEAPGLMLSRKPDKFVPPHLRPGFVAKEERPRPVQKHFGAPVQYGEDDRPKSGGGNDRMTRPKSGGGNRPTSSG
ncbi:hypothetical protein ACE6H2_010793 [Prunus campanulata]